MSNQTRRKRFQARIVHIEYIDFEVLAANEDEARFAIDELRLSHGGPGTDYVSQTDWLALVGPDEVIHPTLPNWERLDGYYPGDLTVKNGDVVIPKVPEVMDKRLWEYRKVYPKRQ